MNEAKLDETPFGLNPAEEGWFVLNLGDALAVRNEVKGGAVYPLEPEGQPFVGLGVNVHVVWPGEPSAMYHSEGVREAFLVLSGECTLIVEEQERPLRQWDFFHCPGGDAPHLRRRGRRALRDPHDRRSARRAAQLSRERGRREARRLGREGDPEPGRGVRRLAGNLRSRAPSLAGRIAVSPSRRR